MSTAETSGKRYRGGRQKIQMEKITNENNCRVTFSKRRFGLFKKASELCTICDPELALIIFSPSEKAFSFGHPSVEAVIHRYLLQAPQQTSRTTQYINAHRSASVGELNEQLSKIYNKQDGSKNQTKEIKCLSNATLSQLGLPSKVDEMDMPQLEQFKAVVEELKKLVTDYVAVVTTNPPPHQFFDVVGDPANTMIPINHPPTPPPQVLQEQLSGAPMPQTHQLFGFNNMGENGGPPETF